MLRVCTMQNIRSIQFPRLISHAPSSLERSRVSMFCLGIMCPSQEGTPILTCHRIISISRTDYAHVSMNKRAGATPVDWFAHRFLSLILFQWWNHVIFAAMLCFYDAYAKLEPLQANQNSFTTAFVCRIPRRLTDIQVSVGGKRPVKIRLWYNSPDDFLNKGALIRQRRHIGGNRRIKHGQFQPFPCPGMLGHKLLERIAELIQLAA